ncbi:hypothetical protein C5167_018121 [Papaver somniferum]|uniref:Fatty acid hydroxylase domain-containing protein n=1 Tax=Papaver somniferum TaxID=3469 RepID=A0A4Y7ILW1_PAPSO|nr:hypothetical protein C5167_018121 [Papaver somniferum]
MAILVIASVNPPSYHALHHTQFRKNYSLFVPLYDYMYGTIDTSTDHIYETSLKRTEESPDVVHLTHPTTPDSIYHLRLGFASLASEPAYHNSTSNTTYKKEKQRGGINRLIEEAILDADKAGVKVLSLGLLNQARKS